MFDFNKLLDKSEEGFDLRCKYYASKGGSDFKYARWGEDNGTELQRKDIDFTCVFNGKERSCSEKVRNGKYYGDVLIEVWSKFEEGTRGWLNDSEADLIFLWWPDGTVVTASSKGLKAFYTNHIVGDNRVASTLDWHFVNDIKFDECNSAKSVRTSIRIDGEIYNITLIGARTSCNGKLWTTYSIAMSISDLAKFGVKVKEDKFVPEEEPEEEPEEAKPVESIELNNIYNMDCREGLRKMPPNSVDLTITSPPYDNLRSYGDTLEWGEEIFKEVANELYRVTKPGGIVVWVVGDAVINGGETGSSFRQVLYFQEIGFKIHDTMIYEKNSSSFPARADSKRYSQIFEYMFVFVKGKIRSDIKLIADKKNKWAGWTTWGNVTTYNQKGELKKTSEGIKPVPEFSLRTNIWKYSVGFNDKVHHPAVFPEKLAEDHILSWSVEGDVVLDPFMGSGTTAKMCLLNGRNFIGFEKNEAYYNESLERLSKYSAGHEIEMDEERVDGEDAKCSLDPEENEKTELWEKLHKQLESYFNDQSVETLKLLELSFKSKANDERVKKYI